MAMNRQASGRRRATFGSGPACPDEPYHKALAGARSAGDAQPDPEAARCLAASIIQNTSEGVLVTDAERRIVSVNPAFTVITGFKADDVVGRPVGMLRSGRHHAGFYRALWTSLVEKDRWQGEIWGRRKDGEPVRQWLTVEAIRAGPGDISHFVGLFSDLSSQDQARSRLYRGAWYDALTELPNRQLFLDRLSAAVRRGPAADHLVGLLYLDLDRFKDVNRNLGHAVGDRLLVDVANLLAGMLCRGDTLARVGGDEFTLIACDLVQPSDVMRLARRILHRLDAQPFFYDGQELFVTASIGVALHPVDAVDVADLLRGAEAAMHRAKEAGRNTICGYFTEAARSRDHRLGLDADLRRALERRELLLEYQPRVSLKDYRVVGCEALLRWDCPKRGRVAPGRFIPVAEESGFIVPVGRWVIDQAARQVHYWRRHSNSRLRVAINISAVQLRPMHAETLFNRLVALRLEDYGAIELELTESVLMGQPNHVNETLTRARELGVLIAIDDFGTGYSSLSYLKSFPIDSLKIDASFVRDVEQDPSDAAIVVAIIAMGHALGLRVVAEGVETPGQLAFLKKKGCDEAQGFLFSRPLSAGDMGNLLLADRPLWSEPRS